MMKGILFDIQLGCSGDMLIGSLIDNGLDHDHLISELKKLHLTGWNISPQKTTKYMISGISANISSSDDKKFRSLKEIKNTVYASDLSDKTKNKIIQVFTHLATAEARVHNTSPDKVHLHETGAIDTIIDISSFCIAVDILGIKKVFFNEFSFGQGSVMSSHGELPVPVPAVVELTRGLKSRMTEREGELITPTAAAILTTVGTQLVKPFSCTVISNGIGFGSRDYPFASYTRALMVKTDENEEEEIVEITCNIDDMNPELYPYIIEKLLNEGALDAYISPVIMKKGRPGTLITVITDSRIIDSIKRLLYSETTTLGMRILNVQREKLDRSLDKIQLYNQEIRIKIGYLNGEIVTIHPEFEDCKITAIKSGIPCKDILYKAKEKYSKKR